MHDRERERAKKRQEARSIPCVSNHPVDLELMKNEHCESFRRAIIIFTNYETVSPRIILLGELTVPTKRGE